MIMLVILRAGRPTGICAPEQRASPKFHNGFRAEETGVAMNDQSSISLLSRRVGDVQSVVGGIDTRLRRILDGTDRIERPGGLVARLCACTVLSRLSRQPLDGFAKQHFRGDHGRDRQSERS